MWCEHACYCCILALQNQRGAPPQTGGMAEGGKGEGGTIYSLDHSGGGNFSAVCSVISAVSVLLQNQKLEKMLKHKKLLLRDSQKKCADTEQKLCDSQNQTTDMEQKLRDCQQHKANTQRELRDCQQEQNRMELLLQDLRQKTEEEHLVCGCLYT